MRKLITLISLCIVCLSATRNEIQACDRVAFSVPTFRVSAFTFANPVVLQTNAVAISQPVVLAATPIFATAVERVTVQASPALFLTPSRGFATVNSSTLVFSSIRARPARAVGRVTVERFTVGRRQVVRVEERGLLRQRVVERNGLFGFGLFGTRRVTTEVIRR